jgi:hypothetical protein
VGGKGSGQRITVRNQKLKLAPVKPNTLAREAEIDLHAVEFQRYHRLIAGDASHYW